MVSLRASSTPQQVYNWDFSLQEEKETPPANGKSLLHSELASTEDGRQKTFPTC